MRTAHPVRGERTWAFVGIEELLDIHVMSEEQIAGFKKAARERLAGRSREELVYARDGGGRDGYEVQVAGDMIQEMDHTELMVRLKAIETPHWTMTWGFGVAFVAAIASILAAIFGYPAWQQWVSTRSVQHSDSRSIVPAPSSPNVNSSPTPPASSPPSSSSPKSPPVVSPTPP